MEKRIGNQLPTTSFVLEYEDTCGDEAVELYEESGKTAQPWQRQMLYDIMARQEDGLWVHTRFGYSLPRRNGKNEVVSIRELWGIVHGEHILHTAHRSTTSSSAARRLAQLLSDAGYTEVTRIKKDEVYEKCYTFGKLFGLEKVSILEGHTITGSCDFRTRTGKGGIGEGFDLLIIDEAQEYQDDQESALKYVVTSSQNPQTILTGTPPTPMSAGTVFVKFREKVLRGEVENAAWEEWGVEGMTDPRNKDAWYLTNPSLGTVLSERSVADEVGTDSTDFNIQRLGLWIRYNQKSEISEITWDECEVPKLPKLCGELAVGVKFSPSGYCAVSLAVRCEDGRIFVSGIDCRQMRDGIVWVIDFLKTLRLCKDRVIVDGSGGSQILKAAMIDERMKPPIIPTTGEVVTANSDFEQKLYAGKIVHMRQPSMRQIITNCEKRAIGLGGGFGYKSILVGADISLMESMILAHYVVSSEKPKTIQKIQY